MTSRRAILLSSMVIVLSAMRAPAEEAPAKTAYRVGAARVDITPDYPVRLSGFGFRREESEGVTQRIWAKALAIDDGREPALLITVDNLGVPERMLRDLEEKLASKKAVARGRVSITATHTHTAPMLSGVCPTLFGVPIPADHRERIERYTGELASALERVALEAVARLEPATLEWTVGRVEFAINRRTRGGPVDHDLPVLVARDASGTAEAIWTSYACHCVTLSDNRIGGDWAGFAQSAIEANHPGAVALLSIGCAGDQNPDSGVTGARHDVAEAQGKKIADEVERLLRMKRTAVDGAIDIRETRLVLPLDTLPTRAQWEERARGDGATAHHARVQLARLDRGEKLREAIEYPIRTWAFGDSLAVVFLPGEVVVDYSLRLERELDRGRLWINAYANDAPCYIPSERILREGGYEGGGAMIYYDVPTRFRPGLEAKIIDAVVEQIGSRFGAARRPRTDTGS